MLCQSEFAFACSHYLAQSEVVSALMENKIQGIILSCYSDQKPFSGVLACLDQLLSGKLSGYMKKGKLTGQKGECTIIPVKNQQHSVVIMILGRGAFQENLCDELDLQSQDSAWVKNINQCALGHFGVAKNEFTSWNWDKINRLLKNPILVFSH
jgi:hypothetical protein